MEVPGGDSSPVEGQQVALTDDHGETVYVQLPPNITLDGNSIVTTETTEDGQQILRILAISDNQDEDGTVIETGLMNETVVEEEVLAEENMQISEIADEEVTVGEMADTNLHVIQELQEEMVTVSTDNNQTAYTEQQMVIVINPEKEALSVSKENMGQIASVVLENENTQEEAGEQLADGVSVQPEGVENLQDVTLFQQALALLHQQSNDQVVVTEGDNSIYIMQSEEQETEPAIPQEHSSNETVDIVNPETGNVEPVAKSSLELSQSSESLNPEFGTAIYPDPLSNSLVDSTPITVSGVKRRPGRPRKSENIKRLPPAKTMEESVETEDMLAYPPGPGGRPRRKAAIRFLKNWEALKNDEDIRMEDRPESKVVSKVPRPIKSVVRESDKENEAPSWNDATTGDHPAAVNIKIKDRTALRVLNDIGIHMLYYCKRCTFFSTQLMVLVNHIMKCREKELTEIDRAKAADGAHTSASLLNASLQSIAKRCGSTVEAVMAYDRDLIEIDEHNYAAEVEALETEEIFGETENVPVENQTCIKCPLCNDIVEMPSLPDHMQQMHTDASEDMVKLLEEAGPKLQQPLGESTQVKTTENTTAEKADETSAAVEAVLAVGESSKDNSGIIADDTTKVTDANTEVQIAGSKFRCPQHNLLFSHQSELTQHYVEVHWGVTPEKVAKAEVQKELAEQQLVTPVPVKRGRGRPRKYPPKETVSEADDDTKDPDFCIKSESFLPPFNLQPSGGSSKCKICYKRFPSHASLKRHMNNAHTPDKMLPVACEECKKVFRNRVQLRNHVRTTHEGKKRKTVYKRYPSSLYRKTYMCEECGYTTPELYRLKNHKMSVHEGDYPYKCESCDYKTNERTDMRRHLHKHKGIKRYPCQFCSYRTDQRWLLVNHCQRQHGVQLEKYTRNTRGSFWSNHRKRKETSTDTETFAKPGMVTVENDSALAFTQEIVIEQGIGDFPQNNHEDSYFVPVVTTNEHGEEEVAMYAVTNSGIQEEVAMETIEESTHDGEVVYIKEDGTVLEKEQAALMLLAVGPNQATNSFENGAAVQVETNYT